MELDANNTSAWEYAKNSNIYTCGDKSESVYFLESGQVKLVMLSPSGKECLLAIHTAGDLFGELCMPDIGSRQETAIAMQPTVVRRIPCSEFFARLSADSLVEGFFRYLAARISNQQSLISNLVTIDSEQRLGWTLLQLAHKLGEKGPRSSTIRQRITQEELSVMVGTTRPRINVFLRRFRELKLIELSKHRFLIIKEKKLTAYLDHLAKQDGS